MEKFLVPLVFIAIGFLFIRVSKKNIVNKQKDMNENYDLAIIELKRKLLSLQPDEEMRLKQLLSLRELELLKALTDGKLSMKGNHNLWSAQQGIITIQDIIIKINKIK